MKTPEKITVRLVGSDAPQILVEFDGVSVGGEAFRNGFSDAGEIMFGIEATLKPLGYSLDRSNLYQDMDLTVGQFHRTKEAL